MLAEIKEQPALKPLESDLHHLFSSWFNRGFLELRRIDWNTPAVTLEKLIAHEAVHEIQGWDDLRRRLGADRRCFGFFHPTLPGEPLIFVEVALVKGLASAIHPLLERNEGESGAGTPDTAIFYSISNCEEGLRGISFGNFLIKQVVEELKAELPSLKHFATLSPVPGFAKWLEKQFDRDGAEGAPLLHPNEEQALLAAVTMTEPATALKAIVQQDGWWTEPALRCRAAAFADKALRGLSDRGARWQGTRRSGCAFPSRQWREFGTHQLGGQYGGQRPQRVLRIMVNYLYDPRPDRGQPRTVREEGRRRAFRRSRGASASGTACGGGGEARFGAWDCQHCHAAAKAETRV